MILSDPFFCFDKILTRRTNAKKERNINKYIGEQFVKLNQVLIDQERNKRKAETRKKNYKIRNKKRELHKVEEVKKKCTRNNLMCTLRKCICSFFHLLLSTEHSSNVVRLLLAPEKKNFKRKFSKRNSFDWCKNIFFCILSILN